MENMIEFIQEMVEAHGDKVFIYTKECVLWKMEHPNCFGCPSKLGCGKLVRLMLIMMMHTTYKAESFDDFEKMNRRIAELQKHILDAKTSEELNAVHNF